MKKRLMLVEAMVIAGKEESVLFLKATGLIGVIKSLYQDVRFTTRSRFISFMKKPAFFWFQLQMNSGSSE